METNHCKMYQLTVQSRQMLANRDGVLQMGILQLVADGALWRETILMLGTKSHLIGSKAIFQA